MSGSRKTDVESRRDRQQLVTATGWRVVGDAIPLVAARAATDGPALAPARQQDVVFAARLLLRPKLSREQAVPVALEVLTKAVRRHWPEAPAITTDHALSRPPERYHGLEWATRQDDGAWAGELLWRHPHPVIRGVACTTHVVMTNHQLRAQLSVAVSTEGGMAALRGRVGAGQARPAFLADLRRALRVSFDEGPAEPQLLTANRINGFVREVLLSERRTHAVAVLSPLEDDTYPLDPETIADELVGLAHLHYFDRHASSFGLTDALGDRRLSCYYGALRIYLPGFSCADAHEEHPLLLHDRLLDPVDRAGVLGELGRLAAARVRMPPSLLTSAPQDPELSGPSGGGSRQADSSAAAPPSGEEATAAPLVAAKQGTDDRDGAEGTDGTDSIPGDQTPTPARSQVAASDSGALPSSTVAKGAAHAFDASRQLLERLVEQVHALASSLNTLVTENAALREEVAHLRTVTAVRATSTTALERRIGGLESLLREQAGSPAGASAPAPSPMEPDHGQGAHAPAGEHDEDDEEPAPSLVDVLRDAAARHSNALNILDPAEQAARHSPYEDVDRLAVVLEAMAALAERRMNGALGVSLREAFRDVGIDYRGSISPSTSGKHLQQYLVRDERGTLHDCREHIVLGTSRDPRHCLRIYFTSRAPVDPRFVIGHVGRHFDVKTTN